MTGTTLATVNAKPEPLAIDLASTAVLVSDMWRLPALYCTGVRPMTFKCARFSGSPGMVKAAVNAPALKQGAQGEAVRVLQMAFIDLGFAMPGSTRKNAALPDGIFGPETARVTAAFQRANLLVPDGVAGAKTLARLDQLLDARSESTVRLDKARGNKGTGRG